MTDRERQERFLALLAARELEEKANSVRLRWNEKVREADQLWVEYEKLQREIEKKAA